MHVPEVQATSEEVVEIEYEEASQNKVGQTREYDTISYLVIHHTATRDDLTASQMKLSMRRTYIDNR